jgi:hypothetical protein
MSVKLRLDQVGMTFPTPSGAFTALARPGQIVTVIGDAVSAGKSKQAITSAFEAALLGKA